MKTLTDGTTSVALPNNLDWVDEFNWQPVQQATQYSLSGALLVDEDIRLAGRPITLSPGADNMAAMPKDVLDQIKVWASVVDQQLTLNISGTDYAVRFHHANAAINARPIRGFRVPVGTKHDLWKVTLRFIEV